MATSTSGSAALPDADLQASLELLRSHAATSPNGGGDQSPSAQSGSAVSPHGYTDIAAAASQAHRAVADGQRGQGVQVKEDDYIHPDLRAHATSMMPSTPGNLAPAANMMPTNVQLQTMPQPDPSPPAPVLEQQTLAPAPPTPVQPPAQPEDDNEESPNSRRGKRELSQSKRAAQNRAAQRAFRRRKEEYIKKLEERVNETTELDNSFRYMANQNNLYREYVSTLQSELVEAQGKFPAPPQGLNLNPQPAPPPISEAPQHPDQSQQQQASAAPEPLAAIAQAVMTPPAPMGERQHQEGREEGQEGQDEMDRSVAMQVDSLP